ncbi:hypothetical protein F4776DRAFT_673138 [Hypoxylon sp. NC0597]|nr:hypothetical protein F4776DRAFT_673138 [Hypoxylon sp. NC0597]
MTLTIDYNTKLTTKSQLMSIRVQNPIVQVRNTKDEVKFGDNLLVWESEKLVEYEDNSDAEVVGSYYPVAIDIASTSLLSRGLDVYVDIGDQILGVPFILYGGNDAANNVASSDVSEPLIFYSAGTYMIQVVVSPSWESLEIPWAVAGNLAWRLEVVPTKQVIGINSTRLEFYAITKNIPSFYKSGVDVTLLRRFVIPRHSNSNGASYAAKGEGGSFNLKSYLNDIGRRTKGQLLRPGFHHADLPQGIAHGHASSHYNALRVRELADHLHTFILNGAKRTDADDITVPKTRRSSGPRGPVSVGDTFFVRVSLEGKSRGAVDCQVGNVALQEQNNADNSLRFYAVSPGKETILFCVSHQEA